MKTKKKKIIILTFILILTIFQGCINNNENDNKNEENEEITFYVNLEGSKDFKSIQKAINAASENDTIYVYNGEYFENIIINKSINLLGENPYKTIINANFSDDTIFIKSDNITISGFTIKNSGTTNYYIEKAGINIESNNNTISNNIISNHIIGINSEHSKNNVIKNNKIRSNSEYGIYIKFSENYLIIDNNFFFNDVSLRIKGSHNCEVIRNLFNDSKKGMYFCCGATGNYVYHNSFINQTLENWNAKDFLLGNNWINEDLQQGNYWDDYNGVDYNEDGIGDTPYNVSTINPEEGENYLVQDNYPLMNPII